MQRRSFLAAGTLASFTGWAQALGLKALGSSAPFDFARLKGRARALAQAPYVVPADQLPAEIASLDWDQHQAIRFRTDHALWAQDGLRFQAQLFHLGLFFKRPVHLYELKDGQAQELAYDPALFDYGQSGVSARQLPADLGFAGFRLNFHTDLKTDVAAFLGASYFRAVGSDKQYGLSARGLAIDTGMGRPEEFPDFCAYYLERPKPGANTVVVYALLDSPSVAGAYRFAITPGETLLMEIDAALYPRKPIERLGLAPCTSMFQHGENDRRQANDWRPEIHDSDGLALCTGKGEWLWRPLTNPRHLQFNAFADEHPRGFGLLQRDRQFDHYQDDGVFYDKRPSLWVEPKGDWGAGSVQLVEIPTHDETFDNIVAFWNPRQPLQPGEEFLFGYRLYWGAQAPARPPLAQCVATRTGLGGVVGQRRRYFSWRFAVDFAGGELARLAADARVEPVISVSRGRVEITSARPLAALQGRRALFDLVPDDSLAPITIRLYLAHQGRALSETWLYQWEPPPLAERPAV
jgi:periplasmic glucans biosynthesis protein